MAGLFKFINYNKEGPGVSKEEPQKKGFIRFFEIYFRNFWKLVTANFFYDLCCLPILTYGLGSVGLANITRNISRGKHSFGASDFFDTVKKNWKQGLAVGIINLLITAVLIADLWLFYNPKGDNIFNAIMTGVSVACLFVLTIMKYYMPLLIVTFSLRLSQLYKNCFKFVFLNFKRNILIFVLLIACNAGLVLLAYYGSHAGIAIAGTVYICIYPAFRSYLIQFNIFDCVRKFMIDPYYEQHPDADIQKRLDLGLDVPEEYMPKYDDEDIFNDERVIPQLDEN